MSVHLYTRSSYSILTSTIRIKELVQYAKNLGYTSVALTDHNVMFAAASFIDACKKEGMHPIVGMEAIWKITVEDFPAFILVDDKGNDFFKQLKPWTPCKECQK